MRNELSIKLMDKGGKKLKILLVTAVQNDIHLQFDIYCERWPLVLLLTVMDDIYTVTSENYRLQGRFSLLSADLCRH